MPTLTIGAKNFIAGESSADFVSDRGFSPDSYGLNLTKKRGVLYFNEAATARHGAVLTGNILASVVNPLLAVSVEEGFVDDEGAVYTINGGTLAKTDTIDITTLGVSMTLGTTDFVFFNGGYYVSTTTGVVQLSDTFTASAAQEEWLLRLNTGFRHPMEVVESNLYIGDKNLIHYFDGTTTGVAFTLPTYEGITSLRKHPDGKTLLAFCGDKQNFSHTNAGAGKVYYCNTALVGIASKGWDREVALESQVEGTRVVGGVIYCTWGKNFGYFDGNGLQLLKRLATSATTYSHNITNLEDIVMVRDGIYVLAFGDLGAGKVWWNAFKNNANSENINCLTYAGDNKLLVAHKGDSGGTGFLYEHDYDNSGTNGKFYTNRFPFDKEIEVKRIEVIHDSSGASSFNVHQRNELDTENLVMDIDYTTGDTVYKTRRDVDVKADILQHVLSPVSGTIGYKLIRLHYDFIR